MSHRASTRLAPCQRCGVAIVVDHRGAPVTEHVDSPICRAVAADRAREAVPPEAPPASEAAKCWRCVNLREIARLRAMTRDQIRQEALLAGPGAYVAHVHAWENGPYDRLETDEWLARSVVCVCDDATRPPDQV